MSRYLFPPMLKISVPVDRFVILGRERLFDCGRMRPKRGAGESHKPLQRSTGGEVFFGDCRDNGLTEEVHTLDVPIIGNARQTYTAYITDSTFPGAMPAYRN